MPETNILLKTGTNELEIAEFFINMKSGRKQSFGINVAKVREITRVPEFEEVPHAERCIMGVFKLRDNIIPLIDLSRYLEQEQGVDLKTCKVIITEFNQQNFGFLIHDIARIHRVSWEKVLPPSKVIMDMDRSCITSVVTLDDNVLFMLDFEKIISDINPNSAMNQKALERVTENKVTEEYNILLADDSSTIRDLAYDYLIKGGFNVTTVNDGEQARDLLQKMKEEAISSNRKKIGFDLVVTDIEMPKMDGHTLCKWIKEDDILKSTPVILFSSLIYEELKKKGESVGADAQISKPELENVVSLAKKLVTKKP